MSNNFLKHVNKILNSNIVDENLKLSIVSTLDDIQYCEDMTVSWKDKTMLFTQQYNNNKYGLYTTYLRI